MKRSRETEFKVGIFVIAALLIGAIITFTIGNQRSIFQSKTAYNAIFESVGGLRSGSPVRISGVDVGTVAEVKLRDDGRIGVELSVVDSEAKLVTRDSLATISNKGLLGDKLVEISPGTGEPLEPGGTIPTETPTDIGQYMSTAGRILSGVEGTVNNLEAATRPFGEEQFAADVRDTMHNLAELSRMMTEDDGTVKRLLTDEQMANDIAAAVGSARAASDELARTARSARLVVDEVRTGDGTAHQLIYGQEGTRLVSNLADATGEAATLMRDVREGEGMVHDLIYEDTGDEMMANLTATTADLRAIMADVRAGRGTIGGLLQDPSIYEDVKRLVGDLQRNEILRALVRYSITQDESAGPVEVEEAD